MRTPPSTRFWRHVQIGPDCWLWTASTFPEGYGRFQGTTAHRWSWALTYGSVPPHLFVCHKCDNKLCVRPEHLFLGTEADNSKDMVCKGRGARGVRHHSNKLSEDDVREIRELVSAGIPQREIAYEFGVSQTRISFIKLRKDWGWLT